MTRHLPRRVQLLVRLGLVTLVLVGVAAARALPASAHAYVEETTPAEGAVLQAPPELIRVAFDSGVQAPIAAIRVYDSDSERVDNDDAHLDPTNDRVVIATVRPDVPDGPYVVTWRAVSWDDGHVIIGSFTFWVGAVTGIAPADVAPDQASGWVDVLNLLLRVAVFAGVLVCAGVGLFHVVDVRHRDSRWAPTKARLVETVNTTAQVVVVASALSLPVQALAESGGSVAASLFGDPFVDVLTRPFGVTALARMFALLPFALRARTTSPLAVTSLWVIALTSLALDGHSITQSPVLMAFVADWVHVHAAAVWVGGLVALTIVLRTARDRVDPADLASTVTAFSGLAALTVLTAAATGIQSASVTLGPASNLFSTSYGRALLTKLVAVVVVVGIAAFNRWRLVPAVGQAGTRMEALERLRRLARLEVAGLLLVVAATGLLVSLAPAPPAGQVAEVTTNGVTVTGPGLTIEVLLRSGLLGVGVGALAVLGARIVRQLRREAGAGSAGASAAADITLELERVSG